MTALQPSLSFNQWLVGARQRAHQPARQPRQALRVAGQVVGSVAPGDVIETRVRGRDLERSTSLVVRWFREDDEEYLWRIAF